MAMSGPDSYFGPLVEAIPHRGTPARVRQNRSPGGCIVSRHDQSPCSSATRPRPLSKRELFERYDASSGRRAFHGGRRQSAGYWMRTRRPTTPSYGLTLVRDRLASTRHPQYGLKGPMQKERPNFAVRPRKERFLLAEEAHILRAGGKDLSPQWSGRMRGAGVRGQRHAANRFGSKGFCPFSKAIASPDGQNLWPHTPLTRLFCVLSWVDGYSLPAFGMGGAMAPFLVGPSF